MPDLFEIIKNAHPVEDEIFTLKAKVSKWHKDTTEVCLFVQIHKRDGGLSPFVLAHQETRLDNEKYITVNAAKMQEEPGDL